MNKLILYLINAFLSSLIGAFIEILSIILEHKDTVNLWELFGLMGKSVLIGTIALFIFLHLLLKFRRKPIIGFLSSLSTIAVLMGILFVYDLIIIPNTIDYFRWVMAITTAELLGFLLTAWWYWWVTLYNDKLKKKIDSIID